MESLINFRDFGVMSAIDGRKLRSDRLYRCGHLAAASPNAMSHLAKLDFATVADLRYPGERRSQPSLWPADHLDRILCHEADRTQRAPHLALIRSGTLTVDAVHGFYRHLYATLPFARPYRQLFAATVRRIAEHPGRTLVHCTAGKDRTGIFCAASLDRR